MTGLAAPPVLSVRRRSTMARVALDPALLLGVGGEARVYALAGFPALVAKVYHQPAPEKARKLALMMEAPPALDPSAARLAWPCDVLLAEGGRFAGFLMPRAEGPGSKCGTVHDSRRRAGPAATGRRAHPAAGVVNEHD